MRSINKCKDGSNNKRKERVIASAKRRSIKREKRSNNKCEDEKQ
jgi:hypothetical protein